MQNGQGRYAMKIGVITDCFKKTHEEGIKKAVDATVAHLKNISKAVESNKAIEQTAFISAGNKEVGALIAKEMEIVGKDGVITIEESKTMKTELTNSHTKNNPHGALFACLIS